MRKKYNNPKLKIHIGEVRDKDSVDSVMKGVDYVSHAVALKQVPTCEFFSIQAVKTNIMGSDNVMESAINHSVKKVIILSTDKAVYPINAMGMSMAMMELVMVVKARIAER
jgi:UDP-N-acetylglucosamine 4,6-dehydratase/5-epimerase